MLRELVPCNLGQRLVQFFGVSRDRFSGDRVEQFFVDFGAEGGAFLVGVVQVGHGTTPYGLIVTDRFKDSTATQVADESTALHS